jgi:hypothetical protein
MEVWHKVFEKQEEKRGKKHLIYSQFFTEKSLLL